MELEGLTSVFYSRMDPFLRFQIQKRGVTIIQNTYIGFDTEYEQQDLHNHFNKLISVQYAVQGRTMVKLPLYTVHDISYVHPLTNEISAFFTPGDGEESSNSTKNKSKGKKPSLYAWVNHEEKGEKKYVQEYQMINTSLRKCVCLIRSTLLSSFLSVNDNFINSLKKEGWGSFVDVKKDQIVFVLPLSPHKHKIEYPVNGYSLEDLLKGSNGLMEVSNKSHFDKVLQILFSLDGLIKPLRLNKWYEGSSDKIRTSTRLQFENGAKITLSIVKNHYVCSHYNSADLSMLRDFDVIKPMLSIVNKSFVTVRKPLVLYGSKIYIRDTMLLAPAGKGLDSIGGLYSLDGDYTKIEVSDTDKAKMSGFLSRDKERFEQYAIRDAVIVLKHSVAMEEFNILVKQLGVPLTLSSLGRNYVFDKWRSIFERYFPYQPAANILIGNPEEVQTPKGLFATKDTGLHLSYFIGNYKGGRNESFMYGTDEQTMWYDYDLVSAYTTAMADLRLPLYNQGRLMHEDEFYDLIGACKNPKDLSQRLKATNLNILLNDYYIINGTFEFPKKLKFPSIPCYIDETTTIYPLTGSCLLTGPEYVLALNQGCVVKIKSIFYIPPRCELLKDEDVEVCEVVTGCVGDGVDVVDGVDGVDVDVGGDDKSVVIKPFHSIIKDIQRLRREYPKGSINNLLFKEMGNSIYGNVVRGMSNKKSFDSLTGQYVKMTATELSNPILAS